MVGSQGKGEWGVEGQPFRRKGEKVSGLKGMVERQGLQGGNMIASCPLSGATVLGNLSEIGLQILAEVNNAVGERKSVSETLLPVTGKTAWAPGDDMRPILTAPHSRRLLRHLENQLQNPIS